MLLLRIINTVSQPRWCGSSTLQTRTGQTGTLQARQHLPRRPKNVSLCLVVPFRQYIWTVFSRLSFFVFKAVASPTPSQDDGGFTASWVSQQEHQLGNLQSTEETRREIQEMPSARPPPEDDDEESMFRLDELRCGFPSVFRSSDLCVVHNQC